jgi:hypothetical protein
MTKLRDHLAATIGAKLDRPVERDHETDRERYDVDGVLYDVETVNVRSPEGELEPEVHVFRVEPLAEGLAEVAANGGTCPTCGRPMGRHSRRVRIDPEG